MNGNTRVKICGITRVEDAQAAVEAGADAIGLVFFEKSPRHVTVAQAKRICQSVPAFVSVTALFVDASVNTVAEVLEAVQPDVIQFHGSETPAFCEQFKRAYIKAVRMQETTDLKALSEQYASARGLLLDTYIKGVPGGTGEAFNWQWIEKSTRPGGLLPIILAGGLTAENVAKAVEEVNPWAVDVSGGVEATPGIKSFEKINAFMKAVK